MLNLRKANYVCFAEEFALTESMFFLIRMLQSFDRIEPLDFNPFTENMSLTLNSASGCKVFLTRSRTVVRDFGGVGWKGRDS